MTSNMVDESKSKSVMTYAMVDFATGIHQEHLEEAYFLYEQRLTLFDDPEITWQE